MKLRKISALIASMLIVAMSSSTLCYADIAGNSDVKYLTPEVLMELAEEDVIDNTDSEEAGSSVEETEATAMPEVTEEIEEVTSEELSEAELAAIAAMNETAAEAEAIKAEAETSDEADEEVALVLVESDTSSEKVVDDYVESESASATINLEDESEFYDTTIQDTIQETTQEEILNSTVVTDEKLTGASGFIARIYVIALVREYDESGLQYWTSELADNKSDGLTIFKRITDCPEFTDRDLTDEEYLKVLYKTFFDRDPDGDGFAFWKNKMETDETYTREKVLECFVDTVEWANICARYGILSGGNAEPTINYTNGEVTEGCISFVSRLYAKCLERDGEEEGVNYWTQEIANQKITGKETAKMFIQSEEFKLKAAEMEDEALIKLFYNIFFDRDPEEEGAEYWAEQVIKGDRIIILFNGFSDSAEFETICEENGIYPGPSVKIVNETLLTEDFMSFISKYGTFGMPILESANLTPKLTYKYADVKGPERIEEERPIPEADIQAIEMFFAEHFDDSFTPAMKAAYCFYWIHENMLYARGGNVATTFCVAALQRRYGQCAQYNGALVEILCYLGYDACLVRGSRGSSGPVGAQHYWGELYLDGETYVIEVGNADSDGTWNYFFVPYSYTRRYIVCEQVMA